MSKEVGNHMRYYRFVSFLATVIVENCLQSGRNLDTVYQSADDSYTNKIAMKIQLQQAVSWYHIDNYDNNNNECDKLTSAHLLRHQSRVDGVDGLLEVLPDLHMSGSK